VDVHSGLEMYAVELACQPNSAAQLTVARIRVLLCQPISLADNGWFADMELPADLMNLLLAEHPSSALVTPYLQEQLELQYGEIYRAATKEGWVVPLSRASTMLVLDQTPKQFKAATAGPSGASASGTPLRPPMAAGTPGGDSLAALTSALETALGSKQNKLSYRLSVAGIPHTPHSSVMVLFWVAMDAAFALSGQGDLKSLYEMMQPGSQGSRQLLQFAQEISLRKQVVRHLGTVPPNIEITIFVQGLNSEALRSYAERWLENQRAAQQVVDIMMLARAVQAHDMHLLERDTADRQAEVYAGIRVSRGAGLQASGSIGSSAGRPTQKSAASEIVKLRREDPKTQQDLAAMTQAKQAVYKAGFAMAEVDPKNSNAICTSCKLTARVHLNHECRNKQQQQPPKPSPPAAMGMAAKVENGAVAAVTAADSAGSKEVARLNAMMNRIDQLFGLAAMGGSGQLRPGQFSGGQGASRGGPQQQQLLPCNLCGYSFGHKGPCYCDDPGQAPESWAAS
jgi:hypothetical protein